LIRVRLEFPSLRRRMRTIGTRRKRHRSPYSESGEGIDEVQQN
jgi:hypothetical protein